MLKNTTFTSESVSEGHPDKMADQISDAVLDAIIREDVNARVACETLVKTGMVVLAGEITTSAYIDLEELCREVILDIGYDNSAVDLMVHPARSSMLSANNPLISPWELTKQMITSRALVTRD